MRNSIWWVATTLLLACGCSHDNEENSTDQTLQVATTGQCLMVNMGNYSESNGSIATVRQGETISQNRFMAANGYPIRSIIESATLTQNYVLLMCGNEDKVEVLDRNSFKEVCKAITGIGLPRYATVVENYAYVTCVNPTWRDSVGYITKINLSTLQPEKSIRVKGNPEGIAHSGDNIFVASENGVYQIGQDSVIGFIPIPATDASTTCRYFVEDAEGDLWVSFTNVDTNGHSSACGIAELTPGKDTFNRKIELPKMNGDAYIDIAPDRKTLYYLYSSEIVGGRNPEATTSIYAVDLATGMAAEQPTCTGVGFYGFNVDPYTGNIYTANVNGFITNSMLSVFSPTGTLLQDDLMTGVGTCRFYFY